MAGIYKISVISLSFYVISNNWQPASICMQMHADDFMCLQLLAYVSVIQSESISESESNTRGKRTRFVPPTMDEVQTFMLENGGTHIQAAKFHAYYASNGWKVGKGPMKDWQAAARGWILRDKEGGYSAGNRASPQPTPDKMMRYTPDERRKTYSAAVVNLFDDEED